MIDAILRMFFGDRQKYEAPAAPVHYPPKTLAEHLAPGGRKRVLALDGGGIRGAMSIAMLERVEQLLRTRHGNDPAFRLCDYFDLIGGTSTGAIIASALAAKRFTAGEIKDFYFELGPKVFKTSLFRHGFTRAVFDGKNLLTHLNDVFGGMTLGDSEIATGLAVITKRVDTSSTWVLHNHPDGLYYNDPSDQSFIGNRHYPLKNIIRASTAAPHYFKPEEIEIIAGHERGLFMDGGVTPHNNPAFQLLMLAGLRNYSYNWLLTADSMLMINCGTGSMAEKIPAGDFAGQIQVAKTLSALTSMISGAEDFIELLMQWVGDSPDPRVIDSEVGDLREEFIAKEPLLAYQRYQCVLTRDRLRKDYDISLTDDQVKTLRDMTNPKALPISYDVGQAMAEKLIRDSHFPERFDLGASDGTKTRAKEGAALSDQSVSAFMTAATSESLRRSNSGSSS